MGERSPRRSGHPLRRRPLRRTDRAAGRQTGSRVRISVGIERVIELMRDNAGASARPDCEVYVLHQGGATFDPAMRAAERLRDCGLDVILHAGEAT